MSKRKKEYLIVWGSSVHAVRSGTGTHIRAAAMDAFGVYDPERMTFKQVTLSEIRSDRKRFSLIKHLLLQHVQHLHNEESIAALVQQEITQNICLREAQ